MAAFKRKLKFENYQSFYTPASIFLGGLAIAIAIFLTGGINIGTAALPNTNLGDPNKKLSVSVDDDPVLGDPNAPLTLIEFVDYECPFCKSFVEETLPQIKSQYIDTGKLKLVMRDLPLDFHDPAATTSALAANCARDQGGDTAYFSYHDEIFSRTATNGEGLPSGGYAAAAQKLKLDVTRFNSCLTNEQFKGEVAADLAYILQLSQDNVDVFGQGVGTPAFFLGKSDSSGTISAQFISGAQPFEVFSQAIDALLSE